MNINYNPSRHVAGAVVAVAAAGLLDGVASEEAHSDDVMKVEVLPANTMVAVGMGAVVVVVVPLDEDDMKDSAAGPRLGLVVDLHAGIHGWTPLVAEEERLRGNTRDDNNSARHTISWTPGTTTLGS